jgi:hypothetical protein
LAEVLPHGGDDASTGRSSLLKRVVPVKEESLATGQGIIKEVLSLTKIISKTGWLKC